MRGVEVFVVFPVAAFHFAVVPGHVGSNRLVANAELLQSLLKERICFRTDAAVGKAGAIVRLDALYGIREAFDTTPRTRTSCAP